LSFRRLLVLVRFLPRDSAVWDLGVVAEWSVTEVLLAHIWQATAGSKTPHPLLAEAAAVGKQKSGPAISRERLAKFKAAKRRAAERRRAIDAGELD
jgi:hypothetical protein